MTNSIIAHGDWSNGWGERCSINYYILGNPIKVIRLYRREDDRYRFYNGQGEQVDTEQASIQHAIAAAHRNGWYHLRQ